MKRFINDIKRYFSYAVFSAKSELKAEVANSHLNWIWWVLDPICFMLIYSFIFGVVFDAKEPYFPIFIFVGLTAWDFFNRNINQSVKMIKNNRMVISKVYLPKFMLIISKMFVNGFKMLISFGIVVLMLIVARVHVTYTVIYFIPTMILLWALSFALMTHLMHFGVYVEDLSNVVNIVLRLVFYLTGIFYSITKRLGAYGAILIKVNPMAFVLDAFRNCLIYGKVPSRKLMLIWFVISLIIAALGVRRIYKYENSYAKVV